MKSRPRFRPEGRAKQRPACRAPFACRRRGAGFPIPSWRSKLCYCITSTGANQSGRAGGGSTDGSEGEDIEWDDGIEFAPVCRNYLKGLWTANGELDAGNRADNGTTVERALPRLRGAANIYSARERIRMALNGKLAILPGTIVLGLVLYGCGSGGSGNSGVDIGGSTLGGTTSGVTTITSGTVTGAYGVTNAGGTGNRLDVALGESGSTLGGSARATSADDTLSVTGPLSGVTYTASTGAIAFTATFYTGNGSSTFKTVYTVSGTFSGTTITGTLSVNGGAKTAITLTKDADQTVPYVNGTWSVTTTGTNSPGAFTDTLVQEAGTALFDFTSTTNATLTGTASIFGTSVYMVSYASDGSRIYRLGTLSADGSTISGTGTDTTDGWTGTFTATKQ
jgi:hypothetical protein